MPDIAELTPASIQFLYSFDGSTFTLDERIDLEWLAPADDGPAPNDVAGFWCEVRDAFGTTLWRRVMRHPALYTRKVWLDDGSGGYTNVPPDGSIVRFSVIVPGDFGGADTVALVGTDPLDPSSAAATDLLVHSIV